MKYVDELYGPVDIDEPVLLDLMACQAMQRLRGVLQHGITALLGITRPTTRFEHSLGVMILVKRFGGPLEEQIAALLHDVSHTAFSHVIDYVFNGHDSQDYHEAMKARYVADSDIPDVLEEYGYDWRQLVLAEEASQEKKFPLLEQPSPALCADRLDYFLRDCHGMGLASDGDVQFTLGHLVVHNGRIVADNLETAHWMAYTFIAADEASWANFREVGLYELTARAIRIGLQKGIIGDEEIWGTDELAWARLNESCDEELRNELALISPHTRFEWDEEAPTFRVSTKLRTIDPPVLLNGRVHSLSSLDPKFARYRAGYLKRKSGKWPMRVIP